VGGGEVSKTMYTHVSKCKNDKINERKEVWPCLCMLSPGTKVTCWKEVTWDEQGGMFPSTILPQRLVGIHCAPGLGNIQGAGQSLPTWSTVWWSEKSTEPSHSDKVCECSEPWKSLTQPSMQLKTEGQVR
jgi:hypothetical protein